MYTARQRRIEAREKRQESLHTRGVTANANVINVPQPKNLVIKEKVTVKEVAKKNNLPKVAETIKRGRGRPPKVVSDKNNVKASTKKPATRSIKKVTGKSKEKR